MNEAEKPFPFLSDSEFSSLSIDDRTMYLAVAQEELERRQSKLREQLKRTIDEQVGEKAHA